MAPPSLASVVGRRSSSRNAATSKQIPAGGEGGGDDVPPPPPAVGAAVAGGSSASKRKQRPQTSVDDDALAEIVAFVKKQRLSVVSAEEKLDILLLQAKFRHEHQAQQLVKKAVVAESAEPRSSYPSPTSDKSKNSKKKTRQFEGANATQRIAGLLNRKKDLVAKVWADYCNGLDLQSARPAGNYAKKSTLVPHTHAVVSSVHEFILARRADKLRVIARDVMNHLETTGFIHVDRESPKASMSTLRSVSRFLNRIGYKGGAKKGVLSYTLRKENSLERDTFLVVMTTLLSEQREAKENGNKRIVYVGESYVFEKYARDDSSVFDANDEQDLEAQASTPAATEAVNGKRLCFITAIVDANHHVPEDERAEFDNAHLLQDTLVIFEGGKKQTKDFRRMFYHNSFLNWLEALFATLRERGIENATIVMENSKFHRELPKDTPCKSMTKEQMQQTCAEFEIPFDSSELRSMLWVKLQRYIEENVKPVVCELAAEQGHEIVFSPLHHHTEFQPIESVFAIVKREVGRQYTADSTFDDVHTRLHQAFENLSSEDIQRCIDDANTRLEQLMVHVTQLDDMDISEDDEDEDGGEATGNAEADESEDESGVV